MTPLKWFAGGSERRCEAMTIIDYLLEDIEDTPQLTPLKNQLVIYKKRLKNDGTSTPFILNQMNVDVSRVLIDNKLMFVRKSSRADKEIKRIVGDSLWLLMECRDKSLSPISSQINCIRFLKQVY